MVYEKKKFSFANYFNYEPRFNSAFSKKNLPKKLTTGQGEGYTISCLLDYDYIKNHYRLIPVDLSRQKQLHADPKAIQQKEFARQLKNQVSINSDGIESMFVLTVIEKVKETRLKFFQGSVTVL